MKSSFSFFFFFFLWSIIFFKLLFPQCSVWDLSFLHPFLQSWIVRVVNVSMKDQSWCWQQFKCTLAYVSSRIAGLWLQMLEIFCAGSLLQVLEPWLQAELGLCKGLMLLAAQRGAPWASSHSELSLCPALPAWPRLAACPPSHSGTLLLTGWGKWDGKPRALR